MSSSSHHQDHEVIYSSLPTLAKETLGTPGLSYSLRHIGHNQSHINNGYFKLVEALPQIRLCFFSHSI